MDYSKIDAALAAALAHSQDRENFTGNTALVFGVELHEILYDPRATMLKLLIPDDYVPVRDDSSEATKRPPASFIGGEDGDVFIDLD